VVALLVRVRYYLFAVQVDLFLSWNVGTQKSSKILCCQWETNCFGVPLV
jgi:hypothetical protein